jgi:hypothetical protein
MSRSHWTETAERVWHGEWRLLGECDEGYLWVPAPRRCWKSDVWWDRRFNPWNPLHWRFWLRSRLTRTIAYLERP